MTISLNDQPPLFDVYMHVLLHLLPEVDESNRTQIHRRR